MTYGSKSTEISGFFGFLEFEIIFELEGSSA
jgi:hypothetical protein